MKITTPAAQRSPTRVATGERRQGASGCLRLRRLSLLVVAARARGFASDADASPAGSSDAMPLCFAISSSSTCHAEADHLGGGAEMWR
jgi:hypothetical protein